MRMTCLKAILKSVLQGTTVLLSVLGVAGAQQTINLTAAPTVTILPDGSTVPMWGYSCGAAVTTATATCRALNPASVATTPTTWSPIVITVPYVANTAPGVGTNLTISLTNNLTFQPPTPTGGTAPAANSIPTSIMIVGQVGGGLGSVGTTCSPVAPTTASATGATCTASPAHGSQSVTWPIANTGASNVPPPQGPRIQSFATEVPAVATTVTTGAVALTWNNLKPGTYLIESGTHPSIQVPMGLYGILVVTAAPTATTAGVESAAGTAYPAVAATTTTAAVAAVTYDAEVPLEFGEIDAVQNNLVNTAVNSVGFSELTVWSGQPGGCGNPTTLNTGNCYPPVVNYTPLYYTINGVAFNKTSATSSLFAITPATIAPAAGTTGTVLVRMVNAGSRMHVPAIVGSQVPGATGATNPVVTGFNVVAEDGNHLPGLPKIRSEVFMAAGKTFDVTINGQNTTGTTIAPYASALAVYDRELSLSGNATARDAGMLAYIKTNPASLVPADPAFSAAVARADSYSALVAGLPLTVSDPSKGVIANDSNVYGVTLLVGAASGTVTLNRNGTFSYVPTGTATSDSFTYCANGSVTAGVCSSGISASVTLGASNIADSGITCTSATFNAKTSSYLAVKTPGVLAGCKDGANLPLTVNTASVTATGMTVIPDANGGFNAILSTPCTSAAGCTNTFSFQAQNSHGVLSAATTMTVVFPIGSGLAVKVLDGMDKKTVITDYRWIIEEDRTFYINPNCTTNPPPASCPTATIPGQGTTGVVPALGSNFHTSYMPYVAQGCTGTLSCESGQTAVDARPACTAPGVPAGCSTTSGQHVPVVCDEGNGACRYVATAAGKTPVSPSQVALDPTKRYYISILPGDSANPFSSGYSGAGCSNGSANAAANGTSATNCGHGMGGAQVAAACTPVPPATTCTGLFAPVTVLTQPAPYPTGKYSVMVFEDDFPLNGEMDTGGGVDVLSPIEPGLGDFQIHLFDAMGKFGDFTGQMTYDMFNQPLSNSLAGTKDPNNGNDACPVTSNPLNDGNGNTDPTATGITGMVVTCPKYESDGITLSPLAGQAVIANLMPGQWAGIATPGADRIARGEEWLQTNTLDGQKGHDIFTKINEPSYFQEYGPASFHNVIGFANPAIINARKPFICGGADPFSPQPGVPYVCNNTITGKVTGERLSRPPDERLFSSGSHDTFYWTQCYVSFGDPDGEDFAFTKCNGDGTFTLTGLPPGDWRVTVFDQWNDLLVDGLSTPVGIVGSATGTTVNMGDIATVQWQTNLYTRTFIDDNKDGLSQADEAGIPFANVGVRMRDGQIMNLLVTDFNGTANFNETFPLFNWYTVETDVTRYKNTGTHVVYDVGGPADGTGSCGVTGYPPCGTSTIGKNMAATAEVISVPTNLRVPGAVYCAGADCTGKSIQNGPGTSDPPSACTTSTATPPITTCSTILSSGRIDPPWVGVEGWQGFPGQNNFLEFGKEPYVAGENGGIKGHVIYASTRPFDDPMMLVQTQWEPLVPHVGINLYKEGFAVDGITPTLTLVDHTQTSSFDDYAQGFRADGVTPNMSCPGQAASSGAIPDLFFFSLYNQPNYLNFYNSQHGGPAFTPLPDNSQFKCYDGMHNWNQLEPAPYDGMYRFPSVTAVDANGKPTAAGTNCTICTPDPVAAPDLYNGIPMLPAGKYVVEVVLPPGFELVKEEDKNILIGDNFIAPVTQEFGGLGNIFIMPDQASVASQQQYPGPGYNANNAQNPTNSLGTTPSNNIVPGFIPEPTWPCVGEMRVVPDFMSIYPNSNEVAPFAGATRPLCDRKEVTLGDQMGAIAKFYIYTSTHVAGKFTGVITDDFTSEFDPFSPQYGEKFSPPDMPISVKDWAGNEISRVYSDHWGAFDGMTYSTWEVNPPNPTGYSPTMMVMCMNDPGPIPGANGTMITDPLFASTYSQFCYELPFMPAATTYLDTPVVPNAGFAGAGYNNVDCAYPDLTPAIAEVDGDQIGPWVSAAGKTLTVTALGDQMVANHAYSGPSANTAPYNQKFIKRHYGFGATAGKVTIGGVPATVGGWSDTSLTVTVPAGVPNCAVQQQAQYAPGATSTQCGELVITAASGKQSIDTVNVTIGGKAPKHIAASGSIQAAIDAAAPGDLLIVDPTCTTTTAGGTTGVACTTAGAAKSIATHNELVIMWKPVRLQGVGSASSVINANTQPAGKMDPWRQRIVCLFGLTLQGTPITPTSAYDPSNQVSCGSTGGTAWKYFTPTAPTSAGIVNAQVDPLPLEAIVGWDATQNGNLAQLLQEPSLMGALEGAGITVLGKGVNFPSPVATATAGTLGSFPTGTTLLTGTTVNVNTGAYTTGDGNSNCHTSSSNTTNPFPSNFSCNPSSIDGLGITDSSQGGGGIFVHGWNHNLQIANNHIFSNAGSLSGGINLGQGEFAPSNIQGSATNSPPGSCVSSGIATNAVVPNCDNLNVNIHNNNISLDSSTGDELFSGTPAGAGGASICNGSDYYKFNYNWVCGNLSTGDGGGVGQLGMSYNGDIEHNSILFNQSLNPTIPANGGGLLIMGTPDVDTTCGATVDIDCLDPAILRTPSDGVGPNLVINANLIMGNAAESGSGGGIRLQNVNGGDVLAFPTTPSQWWSPRITNNIIADNVAGWDGAGISMVDTLNVNIINNTVVSNSTTASAGILFKTLGAPIASSEGTNCTTSSTTSCPQPAGLVSIENSANLQANLPATVTCPPGHYQGTSATNGTCKTYSYPLLMNNIFWQNSAYYIGVGALSPAFQQNVVSLYNAFTTTLAPTQSTTGQCVASNYWEIGARGDTGPTNHGSGVTLAPQYSVLTDVADYPGMNNSGSTPSFVSQYCDGSRTPPEFGASGFNVPPGISDAVVPQPIFNLTPVATVDEGNNWINMRWGPLSLTNPTVVGADGNYGGGAPLGNYALAAAMDTVSTSEANYGLVPATDFFGNKRPEAAGDTTFDPGAVEFGTGTATATLSVTGGPLAFGSINVGTTSAARTLTLSNTGTAGATTIAVVVTAPFSRPAGAAGGTCVATLAAATTCTINVVFTPTATGAASGTATITANVPVTGSPVALSGTGTGSAALTVRVSPTSLTFGSTTDGTTSASQPVTVTATGNGTFFFNALAFTGPFARAATGGSCGANLVSPATCTINVVFSPTTQTGTVTGSLAITGNVTVTGSPVSLTGTATASTGAAVLSVTGGPLTFNTASGTTSTSQQLTLHNTGTAAGTGIGLTFTTGFSRPGGGGGGTCTTTLAAAATCTINVVFAAPATAGSTNGTLTVAANVAVTGSPVALTGNSVTPIRNITVTPNPAAFGSVQVGGTDTLTLTITASASNNTTAARPTVAAPFARTGGTCGGTIAIGATCTYIVGFTPTTATASTGTMTDTGVTINGGTGETLTGTGATSRLALTGPVPALNPSTANTVTESGTVTVTYSSTATGTFTFTAAPAIGGGGRFTSGGGTCTATTVLNPGSSCTVIVTYAAAGSTTTRTGTVTVTGTPTGLATESTSISFSAN